MSPEFERALSLIIQRYQENEPSRNLAVDLKSMRNCIAIDYENTITDSEGYFIFDSTRANLNYLPIYANSKYKKLDDISTALLLAHELTHVVQFVNEKTAKEIINCYQKEIDAFFNQYNFALSLNPEEKRSLTTRISENTIWQVDKNSQIQITKELMDMSYQAQIDCQTNDLNSCWRNRFLKSIENLVRSNPSYIKQCSEN